jgi:hypothetical protein
MKVRFASMQLHCFGFGGFEAPMESVFETAKSRGVNSITLNLWSCNYDVDVIYGWELGLSRWHVIHWSQI